MAAAVVEEHVAAEAAGERAVVAVRAQAVAHRGGAVGDRKMWLRALRRCHGRVLQTSNVRVGARAKLQIVDHRWATCRRLAVGPAQEQATGLPPETSPAARVPVVRPAGATLPIDRTPVISPAPALVQALVRELSPAQDRHPAHVHRHVMCRTLLICRMLVVVTSAGVGHPAALVTLLRSLAARWQAEQLPSFCKIVRATLVFPVSPGIESMPD